MPHPLYTEDQVQFTLADYDRILEEWYARRGCDPKTGLPTRAELLESGLEDVAKDLEARGLLPPQGTPAIR